MGGDESHRYLKALWADPKEALAYREKRFTSSRRWRWTDAREKAIVAEFLSLAPPGSVGIDVPCGTGRFFSVYRSRNLDWVGVDASLAMARLSREEGPKVVVGDAAELPFKAGSFYFCTCIRLLHRIRDPRIRVRILRELARVCRGPILVTYYLRWNLRGIRRWIRKRPPGLSMKEVRSDAMVAGLTIRKAKPLRRLTQQQWFFLMIKEDS
jgi:hypothetical protein